MKKWLTVLGGFAAGVANGLLGAGGGLLAVPVLRRNGLDATQSHATSLAVILPVCAASAAVYLFRGSAQLSQALPYLPWTLLGSALGAWLLPKLGQTALRRLFSVLMFWAAYRMFAA